jgi:nitroimidazol reductase NimA-like FMN-containing flavoprotein (pyridoxamine 5'-phosphate oxidase superfamily)
LIIKSIEVDNVPFPGMNEDEISNFLESKLNLQLATIDAKGDPIIQPVWFDYEKESERFYIMTSKSSRKVKSIRRKPAIYFSIDDDNYPYKGVKGKGTATIIDNLSRTVARAEKINLKYLGTLEHPTAKTLMDYAQNGKEVLVEINPKYFSSWDFSKA